MANKLKDIFSNDVPEYTSKVKFKDPEAYKQFCAALNTVWQEGSCVDIEGVDMVSTYMNLQGIQLPIEKETNVSKFVIGPSKETVPFSVVWDNNEKVYSFYRYGINDGVVLETDTNAVIYMKIIFFKESEKVTITYQMQFQYAKTIEDLIFEINACISFLTKLYDPSKQIGTNDEITSMRELVHQLKKYTIFFSHLLELQQILGFTFSTGQVGSIPTEEQQEIEELYLMLCKKVTLKINAKNNSTDTLDIESSKIQAEPVIGTDFSVIFVREATYNLLGQEFSIYTSNALINAVVKDIKKEGEKATIFYGDTDSQPMYMSVSGFVTEEEAKKEISRDISKDIKYINALTSGQYIKEIYKDIENQ